MASTAGRIASVAAAPLLGLPKADRAIVSAYDSAHLVAAPASLAALDPRARRD